MMTTLEPKSGNSVKNTKHNTISCHGAKYTLPNSLHGMFRKWNHHEKDGNYKPVNIIALPQVGNHQTWCQYDHLTECQNEAAYFEYPVCVHETSAYGSPQ